MDKITEIVQVYIPATRPYTSDDAKLWHALTHERWCGGCGFLHDADACPELGGE